jgi:hypothetical protein
MALRDKGAAKAFEGGCFMPESARLRHMRVLPDYGVFDRREAPQYHPGVKRAESAPLISLYIADRGTALLP